MFKVEDGAPLIVVQNPCKAGEIEGFQPVVHPERQVALRQVQEYLNQYPRDAGP